MRRTRAPGAGNNRCRWLGHKRRSIDGDGPDVSIRNVDVCVRCGQVFRAKKARDAVEKRP